MEWIISNWTGIVFALTATIAAASAIAKLTPTTHDDEVIQKILDIINALALNKPRA